MKKYFWGAALALLCAALGGCAASSKPVTAVSTGMGTVVQQIVYTDGRGEAVTAQIQTLLETLEQEELSKRLGSAELCRLNGEAGNADGSPVSPELAGLLERCWEVSERSDGAFDITMGPVIQLWNIDEWAQAAASEGYTGFVPPDSGAVKEALGRCGFERLRLEKDDTGSRLYLQEGMTLDLGAVGKGVALDRIKDLLAQEPEVTGAVISVGGSVLTYGKKPDGSSFRVGIADPRDTASYIGVLELDGQWCVSTSGDYERYVEYEGVRYHHIIDPATGYPADSGVAGVTVLSGDGFLSDALSTACFILGKEKGMALAAEYDVEVLFVEKDGTVSMSDGMRGYYREAR